MNGHIEPMVGRYVHVEIDGAMHRIYFSAPLRVRLA